LCLLTLHEAPKVKTKPTYASRTASRFFIWQQGVSPEGGGGARLFVAWGQTLTGAPRGCCAEGGGGGAAGQKAGMKPGGGKASPLRGKPQPSGGKARPAVLWPLQGLSH